MLISVEHKMDIMIVLTIEIGSRNPYSIRYIREKSRDDDVFIYLKQRLIKNPMLISMKHKIIMEHKMDMIVFHR